MKVLALKTRKWLTQEQIGKEYDLSIQSISNILNSTFSKITKTLTPDNLQFYNVWRVGKLAIPLARGARGSFSEG